MDEEVIQVLEDGTSTNVKPKVSLDDRLKEKQRNKAQKRISSMRNKILRGAQWAQLKKEKRKVSKLCLACLFAILIWLLICF